MQNKCFRKRRIFRIVTELWRKCKIEITTFINICQHSKHSLLIRSLNIVDARILWAVGCQYFVCFKRILGIRIDHVHIRGVVSLYDFASLNEYCSLFYIITFELTYIFYSSLPIWLNVLNCVNISR